MRSCPWLAIAVAACLGAFPQAMAAQDRPAGSVRPIAAGATVSLEEVVQRTLRDNADVQIGERLADAALGAAISAHALFDPSIQTSVAHGRQNGLRLSTPGTTGGVPTLQSALTSSVTSTLLAQQRVSWGGIVLAPQVSVTSAGSSDVLAENRASVSLGITLPLARDRGGRLSRDATAVAYAEADAAGFDARQAAANGVLQAVNAYWGYVATQQRLQVLVAAEEHARTNLKQTTDLVAADERPAADLVQLRGNVASKMASRISAEQAVLESWRSLATLLGIGESDVAQTPRAATPFPAMPELSTLRPALGEAATQRLVDEALLRRADLAAVATRVGESEAALRTTDQLRRPVIDVVAQLGYGGIAEGWGVNQFVSPLFRNRSPLNASLQLLYQFSPLNSDANGRAMQAAAGMDAQRISRRATERAITSGVVVALAGLRRTIAVGDASRQATEAAAQTVKNEGSKFRLGSSTVIDVILSEDGLTNALLSDVAGRQAYATALNRLQFELGTLVAGSGRALVANTGALQVAPAIIVGAH